MSDAVNVPTSYRGILRLAKQHNLKLKPMAVQKHELPQACVIQVMAQVNKIHILDFENKIAQDLSLNNKVKSIEAGFEAWEYGDYDPRYVKVGQRLRAHATGNTKR